MPYSYVLNPVGKTQQLPLFGGNAMNSKGIPRAPRGRAWRALVKRHGVREAARRWRALARKPGYAPNEPGRGLMGANAWFGEPERHRKAALLGWRRRRVRGRRFRRNPRFLVEVMPTKEQFIGAAFAAGGAVGTLISGAVLSNLIIPAAEKERERKEARPSFLRHIIHAGTAVGLSYGYDMLAKDRPGANMILAGGLAATILGAAYAHVLAGQELLGVRFVPWTPPEEVKPKGAEVKGAEVKDTGVMLTAEELEAVPVSDILELPEAGTMPQAEPDIGEEEEEEEEIEVL